MITNPATCICMEWRGYPRDRSLLHFRIVLQDFIPSAARIQCLDCDLVLTVNRHVNLDLVCFWLCAFHTLNQEVARMATANAVSKGCVRPWDGKQWDPG